MGKRNPEKYALELLREFFSIGKDGNGHWRVFHAKPRVSSRGSGRRVAAGDLADNGITNKGYRFCLLPKTQTEPPRLLLAHLVIWVLWNELELPCDREIDHWNRNKLDNDPTKNLRAITHRENSLNCDRLGGVATGVFEQHDRPVSNKRFVARVLDPRTNRRVSLGIYHTHGEAADAVTNHG